MLRCVLLLLIALANTSCSGGRVAVALEEASIRTVAHATLFPGSPGSDPDRPSRAALQLTISSQTDLLQYFEDRDTQLQVRCSVNGSATGKSYNAFAIGPIPEEAGETPYRYIVYSFLDLKADEVQYENGRPASTLDLRTASFQALACHLVGVQKAPMAFPKSNDLVVSASTFQELLRGASGR